MNKQTLLNNPKISVIIPVYNVKKYLKSCLNTVINQTFKDLEILLINDGSTDGSGELCDELAKTDDRIRVFHKENGGLSDARNFGIKMAKGKYIGLIDSDDYIDLDMFEILYNNILLDDADVSACTIYSCYEGVINKHGDENSKYFLCTGYEFLNLALKGTAPTISACPKLYKKDVLLDTPFKTGKLYEDAFLLGELFSKVKKVAVQTVPKYYYVHRKNTITTSTYTSKQKERIEAFENNFNIVKNCCPQYIDTAWYRLIRANYEVYDLAIESDKAEAKQDKKEIIRFLKKNFFKIMHCKYIVPTRKLAIILSFISERLYRCILHKQKNNTLV